MESGWTQGTLRRSLQLRVYLGEVHSGRLVNSDAHEPLIDPPTWYAVQATRELPHVDPEQRALLTGLVRCAGCRLVMNAGMFDKQRAGGRVSYHRCRGHSSAGPCPEPAGIVGKVLEPVVVAVALRLATAHRPVRISPRDLTRATEVADQAEAALVAYRDNSRIEAAIGPERYLAGLEHRCQGAQRAWLAVNALEFLTGLVKGERMGTSGYERPSGSSRRTSPETREAPPERGFSEARPAGFEPAASCSGGKRSIH
jgi:hypothetical protein